MQEWISEWRDGLLQKPLLTPQKSLSYPKEIEVNRSTECNPFYLPQAVICILDTYISKKKSFLFWNRMSHIYSIMQLNLGLCTITSLLIKKCCEWSDVGCAAEGRMLPGRRFNPLEAEPDKRPEEEDFRGQ